MPEFLPRNIPSPTQRGYVTRHASLDNKERAAVVARAFADTNVVAWKTTHSISNADWDDLILRIKTAIAPPASQLFRFETMCAVTEAPDTAVIVGLVV